MKKILLGTLLSLIFALLTDQSIHSNELTKTDLTNDDRSNVQITKNLISMPLTFTENQGQWDETVQFRANAGGATIWFAADGAYYQFTRTNESSASQTSSSYPDVTLSGVERMHQPNSVETMMIKASFVGANPNPRMIGVDLMEYKCNYFIDNDPNKWRANVPNYSSVLYEQVYDGIDLKYYGNGRQIEYDFIVSPGADYSQIKIQYEGAESISINENGELVVETKWGEFVEQRPVIYQIDNGSRIAVAGEYKMQGDNSFGFKLSSYNTALSLVIDPVLTYSTYLGGSNTDRGSAIAVDASGSAYITGFTESTNFPTLDPYQGTYQGGAFDVFVTKVSSSGDSLIYSTYLGGNSLDFGSAIAVDASGAVYVTGGTSSTDFPTFNPFEGTYQGGTFDAFVTKLNSSGDSLVYSTYLGGSLNDNGDDIIIDTSGAAYVIGSTSSSDFPTLNPFQGTYQGGSVDAFVTKLNSSGDSLVYSTYLGGSNDDYGRGITVDVSGKAYVIGRTTSTDFPMLNSFQGTFQGGIDAFVTKLSISGDSLVYSTYLGGSLADVGNDIVVDASGATYVTGRTYSSDFPTLNAFSDFLHCFSYDAFVTKLDSSGNSLIYSTYLGGCSEDRGRGLAVDAFGAAYITGFTKSTDFPTLNPFQGTYQGGSVDAFVTKLGISGDSLVYSTYLGGNNEDRAEGITLDASGAVYVTGYTASTTFPTLNPYQGTFQGGTLDAFVTKFAPVQPFICGDINNDGTPSTVLDLTYLIDDIFRGGPEAPFPQSADLNGDGTPATVLDLTFMIDDIFRGGPAPTCGS